MSTPLAEPDAMERSSCAQFRDHSGVHESRSWYDGWKLGRTSFKRVHLRFSYIVNPHISLLKANCIYKYVTSKGIMSSEQIRGRKDPGRRKNKGGGDATKPRRGPSGEKPRAAQKPRRLTAVSHCLTFYAAAMDQLRCLLSCPVDGDAFWLESEY